MFPSPASVIPFSSHIWVPLFLLWTILKQITDVLSHCPMLSFMWVVLWVPPGAPNWGSGLGMASSKFLLLVDLSCGRDRPRSCIWRSYTWGGGSEICFILFWGVCWKVRPVGPTWWSGWWHPLTVRSPTLFRGPGNRDCVSGTQYPKCDSDVCIGISDLKKMNRFYILCLLLKIRVPFIKGLYINCSKWLSPM